MSSKRGREDKLHRPNSLTSPSLLHSESIVFDRAYCNMAICSASRNSFLSGRNPDKTRTWNFINDFRQAGTSDGVKGKEWVTMPQLFKNSGYLTNGHGKIYHPNHPPSNDEPMSWSQNQEVRPMHTAWLSLSLSLSLSLCSKLAHPLPLLRTVLATPKQWLQKGEGR